MSIKFVVTGHVDHGKSTICGHLLYLCNYVNEHEFLKIESKANIEGMTTWKFARILDICEEEQERGKTIDYQLVDFNFEKTNYQLIDTPGHKAFIRALISGISQSNPSGLIGCLVVSVAKGEFESGFGNGQTREDAILMRCVGIEHFIVLVNKMDLIDWDEQVYNTYVKKLENFLKPLALKTLQFIPISGYLGVGLINGKGFPDWYKGESLLKQLKTIKINNEIINNEKDILTTKFKVNLKIFNFPCLISTGLKCVMHYSGKEIDVTFNKCKPHIIKSYSKTFDEAVIITETPIEIRKEQRLIFRSNFETLGYGIVIGIVPL